jgi:hypothetical protein
MAGIRPKIGVIDIETAPLGAAVWGLWDQNVGLNMLENEWTIMSFALKPLGGPKSSIEYLDTSQASHPRNDAHLVQRLWEVLNEYDVLIAHNGKKFDMKKIRARMILLGYKPHSPVKIEDTLLYAKQVAAFTSNKLEWLSTYLSTQKKDNHSKFVGFDLWKECLAGNAKAWAVMKKYNVRDITSLEEVYYKLRPWAQGTTNLAAYDDSNETICCPVCGSDDVEQDGYTFTQTGKYLRYHCLDGRCGAWSRSRYTQNSIGKRKSLLVAT